MRRRHILPICALLLAATAAFAETDPVHLASPDGQIELRLFIVTPQDSRLVRLAYAVTFHGKLLMDASLLGIALQNQEPLLGETVGLVSSKEQSVNEDGNRYNSVIAQYLQNGSLGRRVTIEARAYNDGVAFRYYIPRTSTVEDLLVEEELTDFHFAQDGDAYAAVVSDYQSAKGEYSRTKLTALARSSLLALPLLVEQPGVGWAAIAEAQIDNYPGMHVFHAEGTTIRATLSPRQDDRALAMKGVSPAETPWRVLMISSEPRKLLDSRILLNLNPKSDIADVSWIKPAKQYVPVDDSADLDPQLADLQKRGATGVKIDLKNRSDQQMIEFRRRAAGIAAEHHLMVQFQNAPMDGFERTWPNVLPGEDPAFQRLLSRF